MNYIRKCLKNIRRLKIAGGLLVGEGMGMEGEEEKERGRWMDGWRHTSCLGGGP